MRWTDFGGIKNAVGLAKGQKAVLEELVEVYNHVNGRNQKLRAYYDGKVKVREFGLTIDSSRLRNDQVCFWPQKSVEALAERVRFDRFVFEDGSQDAILDAIVRENNLINSYSRYQPSKYTQGCMFSTIGRWNDSVKIRFHSAETAVAISDGNHDSGIIGAGMAIARRERTSWSGKRTAPTIVNLYEPGRITVLKRIGEASWVATVQPVAEEQPMMLAFTHKSTGTKPFGQSRINAAVRSLTRDAVRTLWRMELSSAFYSIPQRYIIGLSDEMYDALADNKAKQYLDSLFLATRDDDGAPEYGQLTGNSPQPFIDQLRALASMFSGVTGVPLNSLGIVQDNPSSAEAIAAAREDICITAEDDIAADKVVLERMAQLAMAIANNTTTDRLTDAQKSVMAHFKNPTMPSLVSQADAMMKIATTAPWFTESDVFLEQLGFDASTIARIKSDRRRSQAANTLSALASVPNVEQTDSLLGETD